MIKSQGDGIVCGNFCFAFWVCTDKLRWLADGIVERFGTICPSDRQHQGAGCERSRNCDGIIGDCSDTIIDSNPLWWIVKSQGDGIVHSNLGVNRGLHTHESHRRSDSFAKMARDKDQVKDIDIIITVDI